MRSSSRTKLKYFHPIFQLRLNHGQFLSGGFLIFLDVWKTEEFFCRQSGFCLQWFPLGVPFWHFWSWLKFQYLKNSIFDVSKSINRHSSDETLEFYNFMRLFHILHVTICDRQSCFRKVDQNFLKSFKMIPYFRLSLGFR